MLENKYLLHDEKGLCLSPLSTGINILSTDKYLISGTDKCINLASSAHCIVIKYALNELLKSVELYELFEAIKEFLPNFLIVFRTSGYSN